MNFISASVCNLLKFVKQSLSNVGKHLFHNEHYYSQYGQDKFILEHFKFKKDGFFVDIGAYDGVTLSNTKRMEELGWKGICVEPNPDVFEEIQKNRKCAKFNVGITDITGTKKYCKISGGPDMLSGIREDYDPKHVERIELELKETGGKLENIQIKTLSFDSLMADFKDIPTIDYLSIDTEGNELKILKSIDFSKYDIKTLSVENNYSDPEFCELMEKSGYKLAAKIECDEIYIKV